MIVVAPHPDDEIIGMFTAISKGNVNAVLHLFLDNTKDRLSGARELCRDYGLEMIESKDQISGKEKIAVPSYNDYHPSHKKTFMDFVRSYPLSSIYEYTVEKNVDWMYVVEEPERKEEVLNRYYPKQSELWKYNKKYILFEGLKPVFSHWVEVRTTFEGIHYYKDAPKNVEFLRNPHRHLFHVIVRTKVDGFRALEFLTVKKELDAYLQANFQGKTFPYSCEEIASFILVWLLRKYEVRSAEVKVGEDGENWGCASLD